MGGSNRRVVRRRGWNFIYFATVDYLRHYSQIFLQITRDGFCVYKNTLLRENTIDPSYGR